MTSKGKAAAKMLNEKQKETFPKKLQDLTIGAVYEVLGFRKVGTSFGESTVIIVKSAENDDDFIEVFAPKRFNSLVLDEEYDNELWMIYSGQEGNTRMSRHKIEFFSEKDEAEKSSKNGEKKRKKKTEQ